MPLETVTNGIQDLNPSWPTGTDPKSQGDDHMRNTKQAVQLTFPNSTAPWQTTNKITGGGFDASGVKIENVGVAVDATDAARKGDIDAIQAIVDAQNADITAIGDEVDALGVRVDDVESDIAALPKTSWGAIGATGTSGNSPGSNDWTAARLQLGVYRITFNIPATGNEGNQAVNVTPYYSGLTALTAGVVPISLQVVDVYIREAEGSAASPFDSAFGFTRTVT